MAASGSSTGGARRSTASPRPRRSPSPSARRRRRPRPGGGADGGPVEAALGAAAPRARRRSRPGDGPVPARRARLVPPRPARRPALATVARGRVGRHAARHHVRARPTGGPPARSARPRAQGRHLVPGRGPPPRARARIGCPHRRGRAWAARGGVAARRLRPAGLVGGVGAWRSTPPSGPLAHAAARADHGAAPPHRDRCPARSPGDGRGRGTTGGRRVGRGRPARSSRSRWPFHSWRAWAAPSRSSIPPTCDPTRRPRAGSGRDQRLRPPSRPRARPTRPPSPRQRRPPAPAPRRPAPPPRPRTSDQDALVGRRRPGHHHHERQAEQVARRPAPRRTGRRCAPRRAR